MLAILFVFFFEACRGNTVAIVAVAVADACEKLLIEGTREEETWF